MSDEDRKLFQSDPRDLVLKWVEEDRVSADHMLLCCLKAMGHDDIRRMLKREELA